MVFFRNPAHILGLAAMMTAYLLVTTYPYKWIVHGPLLENGVAIFRENGVLQSQIPPVWMTEAISENEITIRLAVRPYSSYQTGPARILTVSRDHYSRNLTIGQQGHDLIVRLRRSVDTPNGTPPFVAPAVFRDGGIQNIVISISRETLRVSVAGKLKIDKALPHRPLAQWDPNFLLALGNELTWERPWRGEITQAKIETRSEAIDVLSPLVIKAPGMKEKLAHSTFQIISTNPIDLLVNLIFFIPIGIFSARCLSRPDSIHVAIIWFPVCLTAEYLQLFIAGRFSSLSDLFLNISGVLIGARVYLALGRKGLN
jgi:hypothetical protein